MSLLRCATFVLLSWLWCLKWRGWLPSLSGATTGAPWAHVALCTQLLQPVEEHLDPDFSGEVEKTKVDYYPMVAWTTFLSLVYLASITSEAFDQCAWRLMDMIYGLLELCSASAGDLVVFFCCIFDFGALARGKGIEW